MTFEELKRDWKEYAIKFSDDGEVRPLNHEFESCEEYKGWLLFRFKKEFLPKMDGYIGDLYKPDGNGDCIYAGVIEEGEEPWELSVPIGKFIKVERSEAEAMKAPWKNIWRIHSEFMKKHYSKKKYRKYVNGCGISSVDFCDKNAGPQDKDRPCIVVNLRAPLPKKLAFPREYKGVRVFTRVVGQIQPYGKLR